MPISITAAATFCHARPGLSSVIISLLTCEDKALGRQLREVLPVFGITEDDSDIDVLSYWVRAARLELELVHLQSEWPKLSDEARRGLSEGVKRDLSDIIDRYQALPPTPYPVVLSRFIVTMDAFVKGNSMEPSRDPDHPALAESELYDAQTFRDGRSTPIPPFLMEPSASTSIQTTTAAPERKSQPGKKTETPPAAPPKPKGTAGKGKPSSTSAEGKGKGKVQESDEGRKRKRLGVKSPSTVDSASDSEAASAKRSKSGTHENPDDEEAKLIPSITGDIPALQRDPCERCVKNLYDCFAFANELPRTKTSREIKLKTVTCKACKDAKVKCVWPNGTGPVFDRATKQRAALQRIRLEEEKKVREEIRKNTKRAKSSQKSATSKVKKEKEGKPIKKEVPVPEPPSDEETGEEEGSVGSMQDELDLEIEIEEREPVPLPADNAPQKLTGISDHLPFFGNQQRTRNPPFGHQSSASTNLDNRSKSLFGDNGRGRGSSGSGSSWANMFGRSSAPPSNIFPPPKKFSSIATSSTGVNPHPHDADIPVVVDSVVPPTDSGATAPPAPPAPEDGSADVPQLDEDMDTAADGPASPVGDEGRAPTPVEVPSAEPILTDPITTDPNVTDPNLTNTTEPKDAEDTDATGPPETPKTEDDLILRDLRAVLDATAATDAHLATFGRILDDIRRSQVAISQGQQQIEYALTQHQTMFESFGRRVEELVSLLEARRDDRELGSYSSPTRSRYADYDLGLGGFNNSFSGAFQGPGMYPSAGSSSGM